MLTKLTLLFSLENVYKYLKEIISQEVLPIFMQLPPNFFSFFFLWPLKTNQNSTTSSYTYIYI